jgi:hypothetical protein
MSKWLRRLIQKKEKEHRKISTEVLERYCLLQLEMLCHDVSPYLLPDKYCSQFDHDVIRKLLPKVTGGFHDDEARALNCKKRDLVPTKLHACIARLLRPFHNH